MMKIDIPIERTFAMQSVDMQEAFNDLASGKKTIIPLGSIDFSTGKDLDQARTNGGLIIWSTILLEQKLESIIISYIFSTYSKTEENKGRSFFSNRIIKADHFSYAVKKGLVIDIVHEETLLVGRDKDRLSKTLKQVMDYRNSFAHGDILYEEKNGCVLRYWSGGHKKELLNDEYWDNLQDCFRYAHTLVDQIIDKI